MSKDKTLIEPAQVVNATEQAVTDGKAAASIAVVIPYCKEYAQGNELLFALRSWYSYAAFPFHIVVIGDAEEWMDGENLTLIECPRCSDIPSVDTLHKLHEALTQDIVTDRFIWTNDDIYLVNPVGLVHIALPKVLGPLNPAPYNGQYAAAMRNTMEQLTAEGLPMLNYGTHTPLLLDKAELKQVLPPDDPQAHTGILYTSLYFNRINRMHPVRLDWKSDPFLLPIVSKAPNEKTVNEMLRNKVFLNNARSGYSPWLEGFLARKFPDKSPCEL